MVAMIFEFWFDPDDQSTFDEYLATSTEARELLAGMDGFEGVERFQSTAEPGKYVALGFFRDESAVTAWRTHPGHRRVQQLGRERFFTGYRLRSPRWSATTAPASARRRPTTVASSMAERPPPTEAPVHDLRSTSTTSPARWPRWARRSAAPV